jgi:hypothetical protein
MTSVALPGATFGADYHQLLGDIDRMMSMPEPKHLLKCSSPKPLPKTQAQAQVQAQAQAAAVQVHVHMQQHQQASWHSSPAGTEK